MSRIFTIYRFKPSAKSKVADLEFTVRIYEQVSRFQITVYHRGRMYIFHAWIGQVKLGNEQNRRHLTAEDLIHKVLDVLICQTLARFDDLM